MMQGKNLLGFLQGAKLYLSLPVVFLLITGILGAAWKAQQDKDLARVKEAQCLNDATKIPNLEESPIGNKLNSVELSELTDGDYVIAYGGSFSGDRYPGAFFDQLSKTGGLDQFSITLEITQINSNSIVGLSPCFPGSVTVSKAHLFDLFVDPYQ